MPLVRFRRTSARFLAPVLAGAFLAAAAAAAPPTDKQIIADLTGPNTIEVRLSDTPGGRSTSASRSGTNSITIDDYWYRGATLVQKANIAAHPNATVEILGSARYTILDDGYQYREFKGAQVEYKGLPNPSEAEVVGLLKADLRGLVNSARYNNEIVSEIVDLKLADDPKWTWHSGDSVSVHVTATYDWREGVYEPKEIQRQRWVYRVRLQRDEGAAAFASFSPGIPVGQPEVLETRSMPTHEALALQALGQRERVAAAAAEAAALPDVEIPVFTTDLQIFAYTHKMLREASDDQLRAYLRAVLAENFFENGGPVLSHHGQELMTKVMKQARGQRMTYAQQYGPDPVVRDYQGGRISLFNELKPIHPTTVSMLATVSKGKMRNGKREPGVMKLGGLDVYVSVKPEHIEYLESFDSPESLYALHAGQRTLATLIAERTAADAAAAAPPPPPVTWAAFAWPEAKYRVELPGTPVKSEEVANGKYPLYNADTEAAGLVIRISSTVYPVELNDAQAQGIVEQTGAAYVKMVSAKMRGGSDWNPGAVRYGRRFRVAHPDYEVHYAAAAKGNAFYTVAVIGPKDPATKTAADRVLGAFVAE